MTTDYKTITDAECRKTWLCYGVSFSIHGDGDLCQTCMVRDRCIVVMGKKHLPLLNERAGHALSVGEVAAACDTDEESVRLVLDVRNGKPISKMLPPQAVPPIDLEKAEPAPTEESEATEAEVDALLDQVTPEPQPAPPETAVETQQLSLLPAVQTLPPSAEAPKPKKAPALKPPPPKKPETQMSPKKKSPPPSKADVRKKKPAKASPPVKKVPPKKKAAVAKKVAPAKSAPTPKVRAKVATPAAEGSEAFARERARSPWVGKLQNGASLTREFNGRTLKVKVDVPKAAYVLDGKAWPTLYSLVMALTGAITTPDGRTTSKWSVKRFFARNE